MVYFQELHEGGLLPLWNLALVVVLIICSCWNNRNVLLNDFVYFGKEDARRILDPPLLGVGYYQHFRRLKTPLQQLYHLVLNFIKLCFVALNDNLHIFLIFGIEIRCWEQGIIVIKNYNILVGFWLLDRSHPHLVLHQSRQVVSSDLLSRLFYKYLGWRRDRRIRKWKSTPYYSHFFLIIFRFGGSQLVVICNDINIWFRSNLAYWTQKSVATSGSWSLAFALVF